MRAIRNITAILLCMGFVLASSGCGANQREKALRATFVTVNVARDGFVAFDAQHQKQIVDGAKTLEEGKAALAAYRQDRERVTALFEGFYHALAAAALAEDNKSLATMIDIALRLQKAIEDFKKAVTPAEKP